MLPGSKASQLQNRSAVRMPDIVLELPGSQGAVYECTRSGAVLSRSEKHVLAASWVLAERSRLHCGRMRRLLQPSSKASWILHGRTDSLTLSRASPSPYAQQARELGQGKFLKVPTTLWSHAQVAAAFFRMLRNASRTSRAGTSTSGPQSVTCPSG